MNAQDPLRKPTEPTNNPYESLDTFGFYDVYVSPEEYEEDYEVSGEEYEDTLESLGLSETNVGIYEDTNLAT